MTRKRAAGLQYQSLGWYGEPDKQTEMVVTPPAEYRGRYSVTALARLRRDPLALDVDRVTVTHRKSGATITFENGAVSIVLGPWLPPRAAADVAARLIKDGHYLAGWSKSQLGRPPLLTAIESDEEIRAVIREMRDVRRITQKAVAAQSGTFTLSALRNYLRLHGRTWAEITTVARAEIIDT